jgi:replicative DNA helicase
MSAPRTRICGPVPLREFTYPPETLERWHAEERAVPGAVLLDGGGAALEVARARLPSPECFDHEPHATVWETIVALGDRPESIDIETLAVELCVRELLNAVGGSQFLGTLTEAVLTPAHVETHATRESVREALGSIDRGTLGDVKGAHDGDEHVTAAADAMETRNTLAPIANLLVKQFELRGAVNGHPSKRPAPRLPSFPPALQSWTEGLHPGQLCVIDARPGSGKSVFREQLWPRGVDCLTVSVTRWWHRSVSEKVYPGVRG